MFVDEVRFDRYRLPDEGVCFLPEPGEIGQFADRLAHGGVYWDGPGPVSWERSETIYWLAGICVYAYYSDSEGTELFPIGRFPDQRSALIAARSWCELIVIDENGEVTEQDDSYLGGNSLEEVLDRVGQLVRATVEDQHDEDD